MRILWTKPVLPFPPTQGTRRVSLQLLQTLSAEHEIHLVAPRHDGHEWAAVAGLRRACPGLHVESPLTPNRRSVLHRVGYRLWSHLRRGTPPVVTYATLPAIRRAVAAVAARVRPEIVVTEYWYAAGLARSVPGARHILFAHDLDLLVGRGAGEKRQGIRAARYAGREADMERAALAAADRVWVLTEGDAEGVHAEAGVPRERIDIVRYGLDLQGDLRAPTGSEDEGSRAQDVLLFGSFAADFNRDALEFTLDRLWPEIARRRPDARLRVAGGGLDDELADRARQAGAVVEGEVHDLRALFLGATVVLVPLRFGGGLRIRLLESLALARATVGTPAGVLGMGPRADREVLVGETPDELIAATVRALEDPELRGALGRRGREWVEQHHALPAARDAQRALLAGERVGEGRAGTDLD